MALIVEDGTGLPNAESYISVADADAYLESRGLSAWGPLDVADKEKALRRATDYMSAYYGSRWKGCRVTSTQSLDWPRYDVPRPDVPGGYSAFPIYYDPAQVPVDVKHACALLALKATTEELAPDQCRPMIREKVGPLDTTWAQYTVDQKRYRAVDMLLAKFLGGAGRATVRLMRS